MVSDSTITCTGDFIISTTLDYRSAHATELCGCLAELQNIDYFLSELNDFSKMDVYMATDCLGVVRKLEKQATVISMSTKQNHIVR